LIRCKLYNNGEGCSRLVDDLVNDAIAAHLIDAPIQHNHLAVEIVEGANPEITIVQQEGAGDGLFVDPLYKGPRGRDLKSVWRETPRHLDSVLVTRWSMDSSFSFERSSRTF
jgi:hypothetical protein